jgi:6-hydroxy-3-succinoylpyridine 3-monooxygenase
LPIAWAAQVDAAAENFIQCLQLPGLHTRVGGRFFWDRPFFLPASFVANRSIIYIDGFNFYYGAIKGTPHKWLNLSEFCRRLRKDDEIRHIRYFTSIVNGPAQVRQYAFLGALSTLPLVNVIRGQFRERDIDCLHVGCTFPGERVFKKHEEKRTDVSIAVTMLTDAYADRCDRLVLISGDSDLAPAVKAVRETGKRVIVYAPTRDGADERHASELRRAADKGSNLPVDFLQYCHFPDEVRHQASGTVYRKPASWAIPAAIGNQFNAPTIRIVT